MTLGGGAGGPGGSGPSTPGTVTVGMATMDDPNSNLILPSSYMRAVASGEVMGGAGAVTGGRKVDTGKTTRKRAKQVIDARYHGDSLASPPVISVGRSTATGTGMTEAERYRAMIRAQQDGDGARGDGDVGAPKKKKKKRRKEVVVETTGGESSRPAQTQTQAQAAVAATEAVTVASREQEGGREGDRTRARRATRRRTGSGRRDDGVDGRLGLARNASMMRRNLWDGESFAVAAVCRRPDGTEGAERHGKTPRNSRGGESRWRFGVSTTARSGTTASIPVSDTFNSPTSARIWLRGRVLDGWSRRRKTIPTSELRSCHDTGYHRWSATREEVDCRHHLAGRQRGRRSVHFASTTR
jgi:hypothetical protein